MRSRYCQGGDYFLPIPSASPALYLHIYNFNKPCIIVSMYTHTPYIQSHKLRPSCSSSSKHVQYSPTTELAESSPPRSRAPSLPSTNSIDGKREAQREKEAASLVVAGRWMVGNTLLKYLQTSINLCSSSSSSFLFSSHRPLPPRSKCGMEIELHCRLVGRVPCLIFGGGAIASS